MTEKTPYRLSGYTKSGYLTERPMQSEGTMQGDPPEFVDTCLNCPQEKCTPTSVLCPLNRTKVNAVTKSGKPDMRKRENRPKVQPDALDLSIAELWRNGERKSAIARELGIGLALVRDRIKKLERIGMV